MINFSEIIIELFRVKRMLKLVIENKDKKVSQVKVT
jgi:hypothetical protein